MTAARIRQISSAEPGQSTDLSFADDVIGVVDGMAARLAVELARQGLRHCVQKSGTTYEAEMAIAQTMIAQPTAFFEDPIAVMMGAGGSADPGLSYRCAHDAKKQDFMQAFDAYVQSLPGARRVREDAVLAADELFTNGSKHAFPNLAASHEKSHGTLRFAARACEGRLILACTDSFGLLNVRHPLDRISVCLRDGVASAIRGGTGGAGIGSYLVFNASISYCLAVEPGKRSTVACALPLGTRPEDRNELPKNLHILIVEP